MDPPHIESYKRRENAFAANQAAARQWVMAFRWAFQIMSQATIAAGVWQTKKKPNSFKG